MTRLGWALCTRWNTHDRLTDVRVCFPALKAVIDDENNSLFGDAEVMRARAAGNLKKIHHFCVSASFCGPPPPKKKEYVKEHFPNYRLWRVRTLTDRVAQK